MPGFRPPVEDRSTGPATRTGVAKLLRSLAAEVDAGHLGAEWSSAKRLRSRIEGAAAALDAADGHSAQARAECESLNGGLLDMVACRGLDASGQHAKRLVRYLEGARLALAAVDSTSE
jgi:hypothetical protein